MCVIRTKTLTTETETTPHNVNLFGSTSPSLVEPGALLNAKLETILHAAIAELNTMSKLRV